MLAIALFWSVHVSACSAGVPVIGIDFTVSVMMSHSR